jgi:hypothetical protein
MSYAEFLTSLFDDGRVSVPLLAPLSDEELRAGDKVMAVCEQDYRLEMPGDPPQFVPAAARWAAVRLFRACQFTVFRDVEAETLHAELSGNCEQPASPEIHYSIDTVFRYLPDLAKLARGAAEHDPLLGHITRWARQWPLSSVGMSGIEIEGIDKIVQHASLLQLYVDRVIARQDTSRQADDRIRVAIESGLGMYPELAAASGREV